MKIPFSFSCVKYIENRRNFQFVLLFTFQELENQPALFEEI